ncbi:hypothetical protein D0Z08_27160 [Nocardioides immobilis]|uniref:Uncharacterized protein n=1 Tax=Nocardioides immobilis TaxID=2049295 RepID=A0A417XUS3_9ACTN|nr:hypothetical protein [Nocardioides immobilis]RHW23927.1 hypothetical protein D0Z08_27160 [Nocardioides immobilis]
MTTEQVDVLRNELPAALQALVTFAAGTGMRQGEVLGLTRDRLRLLGANPVVVVDRQPTNDVFIVLHVETTRGIASETARALESLDYSWHRRSTRGTTLRIGSSEGSRRSTS